MTKERKTYTREPKPERVDAIAVVLKPEVWTTIKFVPGWVGIII